MNKNTARNVGAVFFTGLLLLIFLLFWKSGLFNSLQIIEGIGSFDSINGLIEGAEVRYRGFRVGSVSKIIPGSRDILVYFKITKKANIPADSTLRISFDGLIGEKHLSILPGEGTAKYASGQVLMGSASAGIVDFVDIGTQNLDETKKILSIIYKMLSDVQVQRSLKNIFINVDTATSGLNDLIPSLRYIASNLSELTKVLTPVLGDKDVHQSLKDTLVNIEEITHKTSYLLNDLQPAVNDINFKLGEFLTSAKNLSDSVSDILDDQNLKNDLSSTLKSSKKMMDNISNIGINKDIRFQAGLGYDTDSKYWKYRLGFLISDKDSAWLFTAKQNRDVSISDIQYKYFLTNNYSWRLGLINKNLGLGLDFLLNDFFEISTDIYDVNALELGFGFKIKLDDNINLFAETTDVLRNTDDSSFLLGIGIF